MSALDAASRLIGQCRRAGQMPMFTVTENPADAPGFFVARLAVVSGRAPHITSFALKDENLERIRDALQNLGLVKLDRSPEDDPVILETWI